MSDEQQRFLSVFLNENKIKDNYGQLLATNCRVCVSEECPLYPVDGKSKDDQKIHILILKAYGLQVEEDARICEECLAKVDICYTFKTEALLRNEYFHNILKQVKSENIDIPAFEVVKTEIIEAPIANFEPETDTEASESSSSEEVTETKKRKIVIHHHHHKKTQKVEAEKTAKYKCYICNTELESEVILEEHFKSHSNEAPFTCKLCDKTLSSVKFANYHYALHDDQIRPYKCGQCEIRFKEKATRQVHLKNVHAKKGQSKVPKQKHQCLYCGGVYNSSRSLKAHENIHTQAIKYTCEICSKTFTSYSSRKRHYRLHSGLKLHKCDKCTAAYNQSTNLLVHQKSAHDGQSENNRKFECTHCGNHFGSARALEMHRTKHHTYKSESMNNSMKMMSALKFSKEDQNQANTCRLCDAVFTWHKELVSHVETEHKDENVEYLICELCAKKFLSPLRLSNHYSYHHNDRNTARFKCKECPKVFKSKQELEWHLVNHEDIFNYVCDVCGKKFKHARSISRHKLIHSNVKPYVCDACGQFFRQKSHLKTHKKGVHKVKLFPPSLKLKSY